MTDEVIDIIMSWKPIVVNGKEVFVQSADCKPMCHMYDLGIQHTIQFKGNHDVPPLVMYKPITMKHLTDHIAIHVGY